MQAPTNNPNAAEAKQAVPAMQLNRLEQVRSEITVHGRIVPIVSPILGTSGEFQVPNIRDGGQFFIQQPEATRETELRLNQLLTNGNSAFGSVQERANFEGLLTDKTRLSKTAVIISNITDRWGLVSAAAIIASSAMRLRQDPSIATEVLVLTSTAARSAKGLEYLSYAGKDEIPWLAGATTKFLGFFSSDKKEMNEILNRMQPISPLLKGQEISVVYNTSLGVSAILFKLDPNLIDARKAESAYKGLYDYMLGKAKK